MARSPSVRILHEDGAVVCERCELAETFWTRFRGLMGRPEPEPGTGILFRPGGSVHMFFMRYPLDIVFCDRDLHVLGVEAALRPWRTARRRGAKVTIELAAGEAERRGIQPGSRLRLVG